MLANLPIVFGLAVLLGLFIYSAGYKSSNKYSYSRYDGAKIVKFTTYSCGEAIPQILQSISSRINLERFFQFAIYFLVLDVAVFILIFSLYLITLEILVYTIIILTSTLYMVRW